MRSLVASLSDHPMTMLRGIAELRDLAPTTNVREEVAEQLAAGLTQPDATQAALSRLSSGAQQAWQALVSAGGQLTVPAFTRRYGTVRAIGPGKMEREMSWRAPDSPAEELWYQGLIYRAFADLGSGLLEYFYIPPELLSTTRMETEPYGQDSNRPAATQAPVRLQQALNSFAVDACSVLAQLTDTPLRVTETGRWRGGDDARLSEGFLLPDPIRRAMLIILLQQQGWLTVEQNRLVVQAQPVTTWLRSSTWEQTSALFAAWQTSTLWNDLRQVPALRAEGTWRNDPVIARHAVLAALAQLEPQVWYSVDDFVTWIKTTNPDFQRPDGNYTDWYVRDVASDRYLTGFEAWDEVEGRLLRFLICGPLFWLGTVALGQRPGEESTVFQLTTSGVYWVTERGLPETYEPAHLTVDADFTISAPLTVPLYDRFRLLRFTEHVLTGGATGSPTRHRITRQSLSNARAHGLRGAKIAQFLGRATAGQLPARVEAGLVRWDQHGGAVRISKGAVLRVEDASLLAALRADPVVASLLGELLSAQAVLVKEANLPKLLDALAELGYTSKVE